MEKIIVYTCITGGYDKLCQPYLPAEGFEFICFVKKGTKQQDRIGAWRIEEIPYDWDDNTLLARSQKLNPQSALPEDCDWSLWIDGNIRVTDGSLYAICRDLQQRGVKLAGIPHPYNDCVYKEVENCLKARRESLRKSLRTVTFLRRVGMQEHEGLLETNILFRKHSDPFVMEFDRWWWECLVHISNRDQFTQSFALKDTPGLRCTKLFPDGASSRNFSGVEYIKHPAVELTWLQRKIKYGLHTPAVWILKAWIHISKHIVKKDEHFSFEKE